MNSDQLVEIWCLLLRQAFIITLPILVALCLISVVVGLAQAVTSIQDQTLSAVPRLIVVGVICFLGAHWFGQQFQSFTLTMLQRLSER